MPQLFSFSGESGVAWLSETMVFAAQAEHCAVESTGTPSPTGGGFAGASEHGIQPLGGTEMKLVNAVRLCFGGIGRRHWFYSTCNMSLYTYYYYIHVITCDVIGRSIEIHEVKSWEKRTIFKLFVRQKRQAAIGSMWSQVLFHMQTAEQLLLYKWSHDHF